MTHNQPIMSGGERSVPEGAPDHSLQKGSEPGTSITQATYDPQRRHTCWTLNNWTAEDLERLRAYHLNTKSVRYGCWSQEIAETTGTPHLEGYTAWSTTMSLEAFKSKVSATPEHPKGRLRYEPQTKGTAQENHDYCAGLVEKKGNKLNDTLETFGEIPQQGARTDWRKAVEQVRARAPVVDVIGDQPHLLPAIRALERFATLTHQPPKDRDVRVVYIAGPAGCGKTRAIHTAYPNAYWKPEGQWWDGYEHQEVVVLDDFYSDIPYAQLLRVLDRYPLRLPVKGGFVPANYTTVLITSNAQLEDQYPNITGFKRHALNRRVACVITATNQIAAEDIPDALQTPYARDQEQTPPSVCPANAPAHSADDPGQRSGASLL